MDIELGKEFSDLVDTLRKPEELQIEVSSENAASTNFFKIALVSLSMVIAVASSVINVTDIAFKQDPGQATQIVHNTTTNNYFYEVHVNGVQDKAPLSFAQLAVISHDNASRVNQELSQFASFAPPVNPYAANGIKGNLRFLEPSTVEGSHATDPSVLLLELAYQQKIIEDQVSFFN